ncbi:riboflavin kinase [Nonomuraea sp. NPDC004297]
MEFAARLRGNTRFESIDALIAQIHADVDATRRLTRAPAGHGA